MASDLKLKLPLDARNKYSVGRELARGKYGIVYTCISKEKDKPCALKLMLKKNNKKEDVMREIDILRKIDHPGVLKMTDFMECEKEYILVTELLNGGELFDYLLKKEYLEEAEASHYMKQILDATSYFHRKKIVHLDLKPENIVLKDIDGRFIKIIDFGTAWDLEAFPKTKVMVGTPEFIAPEVLKYEPVTCAADMWAIGIITYVLLTGMSPFLGDDDMETIGNISIGEFEYPDPSPEDGYEDISYKAKSFINSLLKMEPKDRADSETCLNHDWMTQLVSNRNGTVRLMSFRARRRWLMVTRAARLSISLSRMALLSRRSTTSTSSDCCSVSPGIGPDDAITES